MYSKNANLIINISKQILHSKNSQTTSVLVASVKRHRTQRLEQDCVPTEVEWHFVVKLRTTVCIQS